MTYYGWISVTDAQCIERSLSRVMSYMPKPLKVLEVGFREGRTSRGIKEFVVDRNNCPMEFWCVDLGKEVDPVAPFDGAIVVKGDSTVVHSQVPDGFDFIFIDACHCKDHAKADFLNFSPKLKKRGVLLFHDTCPAAQGGNSQHGEGVGVRDAIDELGLMNSQDWLFMEDVFQREGEWAYHGGIMAFTKMS